MHYIGNSIIKDGTIELSEEQTPIGLDDEIYEVVLIEDGVPLFLKDHLARWRESMKRRNASVPRWADKMAELIDWLTVCNGMRKGSLRITASGDGTIQCGFEEKTFPKEEAYSEGVLCGLANAMREDPATKVYHAAMRSAVARQQEMSGEFETLLVNQDGEITEGSCTNVFFIERGGDVVTAPDEKVLHGIVRGKVLEVCTSEGIVVRKECVRADEIGGYASAFISSTPWRIVPIRAIGATQYDTHNAVLRRIMEGVEGKVRKQKQEGQ